MIYIFIFIFMLSLLLAFFSMKDMDVPNEIKKLLPMRKLKGSIVFFKNKVKHYSSSSESSD
ncbi:MAG: hypothetical protein WC489_03670 [Patescibacteria group bacterium]